VRESIRRQDKTGLAMKKKKNSKEVKVNEKNHLVVTGWFKCFFI